MMSFKNSNPKLVLVLITIFTFSFNLTAQLISSPMVGNGMVIQRNSKFPFWGKANAGEKVTVTLNKKSVSATASSDGAWSLNFPPITEGGPYTLTIVSATQKLSFSDVYVGDVWLASGQSNMAMRLRESIGGAQEASSANNQLIRQFSIPTTLGSEISTDIPSGSSWHPATTENAGNFTAVGYYFAKDLNAKYKIPIGIINTSIGGSRIENFMSKEMLGFDQNYVVLARGERERQPVLAYNQMINPLLKFPIKGIIWYQGESNADYLEDAIVYANYFKKMILSWRKNWGLGDIPFLWVQLPAQGSVAEENKPSTLDAWPQLRACQSRCLSLPNTGEATSIDVGDQDIHPKNKKPVGERLALVARKVAYKENIEYSGPRYKSHKLLDNGRVEITFDHMGSGLKTSDGDKMVRWFSIASANDTFVKASAQIEKNKIIVWNSNIPKPTVVRYAWEFNPPTVNLYNNENLPAVPFIFNVENQGFKIKSFKASAETIERGKGVIFSWKAFGASKVTFNNEPVDSIDAIQVWPRETNKYTLKSRSKTSPQLTDSISFVITVTDPKPVVKISSLSGEMFEPNSEVKIKATAFVPGDGKITKVEIYQDSTLLGMSSVAPFEITKSLKENGNYPFYAIATSDKGISKKSSPLTIVVSKLKMLVFEAENAALTGNGSVVNNSAASGGKYMNLADGWTLSFKDVVVSKDGDYQMIIRYMLNAGSPKTQNLIVNGKFISPVEFTAPDQTSWMKQLVKVPLKTGTNIIEIKGSWFWMSFDYISIPVANE